MDFWAKFGTAAKMSAYLVVAGVASLVASQSINDLFNPKRKHESGKQDELDQAGRTPEDYRRCRDLYYRDDSGEKMFR